MKQYIEKLKQHIVPSTKLTLAKFIALLAVHFGWIHLFILFTMTRLLASLRRLEGKLPCKTINCKKICDLTR